MKRYARAFGVMLVIAAAAVVPSGTARADVVFEFSGSTTCDADGMHIAIDIKNVSGSAQDAVIARSDNSGAVNTFINIPNGGTYNYTFDVPHYYRITIKVYQGTTASGAPLMEYGPRTSTSADNCDLALPDPRTDIDFAVTAECTDTSADYTVDVDNLGTDEIELTWLDANGVPHPTIIDSADVPFQFSVPLGDRIKVWAEDLWGRLLYDSGDLVGDEAGCPRPAVHGLSTTIELRCSDTDGEYHLAFVVSNDGDYREFYAWEWETPADSNSSGVSSIEPGESQTDLEPFAEGDQITAAITDGDSFSPEDLETFEGVAEEASCGQQGQEGSGGTIVDTGSTPPVALALSLLAAGAVLTLASRRRTFRH